VRRRAAVLPGQLPRTEIPSLWSSHPTDDPADRSYFARLGMHLRAGKLCPHASLTGPECSDGINSNKDMVARSAVVLMAACMHDGVAGPLGWQLQCCGVDYQARIGRRWAAPLIFYPDEWAGAEVVTPGWSTLPDHRILGATAPAHRTYSDRSGKVRCSSRPRRQPGNNVGATTPGSVSRRREARGSYSDGAGSAGRIRRFPTGPSCCLRCP
jgi:hypothetical protein